MYEKNSLSSNSQLYRNFVFKISTVKTILLLLEDVEMKNKINILI